ncbi:hypothetical protein LX36DRAFT_316176 [Colletotrichum falcatum]|nr:hypothetical protein LX36DRAFT_316176 [Colletotrichum falcatum]
MPCTGSRLPMTPTKRCRRETAFASSTCLPVPGYLQEQDTLHTPCDCSLRVRLAKLYLAFVFTYSVLRTSPASSQPDTSGGWSRMRIAPWHFV